MVLCLGGHVERQSKRKNICIQKQLLTLKLIFGNLIPQRMFMMITFRFKMRLLMLLNIRVVGLQRHRVGRGWMVIRVQARCFKLLKGNKEQE